MLLDYDLSEKKVADHAAQEYEHHRLHGCGEGVDGHVHLHSSFDEERFFRAAADNFVAAGNALGLPESPRGILMLTESSGTNRFGELRQRD